jgi:hypothetical protein
MNGANSSTFKLSILNKLLSIALINITFMFLISLYAVNQMSLIGVEIEEISELDMPLVSSISQIKTHQLQQAVYVERAIRIVQEIQFNVNENISIKLDFDSVMNQFTQLSKTVAEEFLIRKNN